MISVSIMRRGGVLAVGLSAALLAASCSSGGSPGAGHTTAVSARQALLAAATQAQKMRSATEMLMVQISGTQSLSISGTTQLQLKPTLEVGANLKLAVAGKTRRFKEILTSEALYLNLALLTKQVGKPWVKIDLSALKAAGASFAQLYSSLQSSNVSYQAQMFAVCKNARVVGTATVDGVSTTEYACSVHAAAALKRLNPSFRKVLAPELRVMGNSIVYLHIWVDHQNQIRKNTEFVSFSGQKIRTTVTITAINQPVHITPPPASQTATLPGL